MIVLKNKIFEKNSLFPDSNFTEHTEVYIIDETTEDGKSLAEKIELYAPYFDFVIEKKQFPIMKKESIIIIKIDEETGGEIQVDTGEVKLVETGEYEEREVLIDITPLPRPEPEIINEEIDEEKIAMAEAIIDLESRLAELENKLQGGSI